MTKYISHTDTNKLIRKAIKAAFPGVKFSVTQYGGATYVKWENGPLQADVDAIAGQFNGATFDGMQDLEETAHHIVDGERVTYGAKYIFCTRNISDSFLEGVKLAWAAMDDLMRFKFLQARGIPHHLAYDTPDNPNFHIISRNISTY